MAKRTTSQGMTVQLVDKKTGRAERRRWFHNLANCQVWLNCQYPHWQDNYNLEIFYDD